MALFQKLSSSEEIDNSFELNLAPPEEDEEELAINTVTQGIQLTEQFFGALWPLVTNDDITDIDWNGKQLWVKDCSNNKKRATEIEPEMTEQFLQRFVARIAISVAKEFNKINPVLEAETDTLRISVVHESVAHTGTSFCIRKTPPFARIKMKDALESHYITPEIAAFIINAVQARMNIMVCGGVGSGKTEFVKLIAQYINPKERIITIEDNLELHLKSINPEKDIIEMQVSNVFSYQDAIKACLRHNVDWMMISEVRSVEVADYITSLTTGVNGITTIHTDDVRKVPARIVNMSGNINLSERTMTDVYSFLDVAILIAKRADKEGNISRFVDQACMFALDNNKKKDFMIFNNRQSVPVTLTEEIMTKFHRAHIDHPFYNEEIDQLAKELDIPYHWQDMIVPPKTKKTKETNVGIEMTGVSM